MIEMLGVDDDEIKAFGESVEDLLNFGMIGSEREGRFPRLEWEESDSIFDGVDGGFFERDAARSDILPIAGDLEVELVCEIGMMDIAVDESDAESHACGGLRETAGDGGATESGNGARHGENFQAASIGLAELASDFSGEGMIVAEEVFDDGGPLETINFPNGVEGEDVIEAMDGG